MGAAHLSGLPDPSPFPLQRPLSEQVGKDPEAVEASQVLRGITLFEIALHRGLSICLIACLLHRGMAARLMSLIRVTSARLMGG